VSDDLEELRREAAPRGSALALYLEALERRVMLLDAQMNPPEPDPLEVGTTAFRQMTDALGSLKRRG
jgi:hypothetical protein